MKRAPHILPTIILSQFAGTSLWFAGNAITDDLAEKMGLGHEISGHILSMVQFGFIIGTFLFAFFLISDRYPPSKVFLVCSILGAATNLLLLFENLSIISILSARFATGFFLAGIYPVGMKIASDYFEKGLGKALGFLVGALVLGSAAPYLVKALEISGGYSQVIWATSALAVFGGLLIGFGVPEGPYRSAMSKFQPKAILQLFKIDGFRKAAFGYFGHMWELYAFWAFTPFAFTYYNNLNATQFLVPLLTFIVIALGGLACALGGLFSLHVGSKRVALISLLVSGLFCCCSPLLFLLPPALFVCSLICWGMFVAADSPQFSTLVAQAAPTSLKGTALTLSTCLGFGISILSIQLLGLMSTSVPTKYIFLPLSLGALLGISYFRKLRL